MRQIACIGCWTVWNSDMTRSADYADSNAPGCAEVAIFAIGFLATSVGVISLMAWWLG